MFKIVLGYWYKIQFLLTVLKLNIISSKELFIIMAYQIDISDLDGNPTLNDIKKFIKKRIKQKWYGAKRMYLLHYAYWEPNHHNEFLWAAKAPIISKVDGYFWPIYDISLDFADETEIKFISYKGDYQPTTVHYPPNGNLKCYDEDTDTASESMEWHFQGEIWTRGF